MTAPTLTPQIRAAIPADWPQLWPIIEEVVQAGETFTYDPAMTPVDAQAMWIESPPGLTVVAVESVDGDDVLGDRVLGDRVLGTAKMGANRPGPGAHVATASFMVAADARGRGVGTALCAYALDWARTAGFAGMQFNAVAASNASAVAVYERLGFEIVGTVPRAFEHPSLGRVGLHVMYCEF